MGLIAFKTLTYKICIFNAALEKFLNKTHISQITVNKKKLATYIFWDFLLKD